MMPGISLDLHSWQILTQAQFIRVIPDEGSFTEQGFGPDPQLIGTEV